LHAWGVQLWWLHEVLRQALACCRDSSTTTSSRTHSLCVRITRSSCCCCSGTAAASTAALLPLQQLRLLFLVLGPASPAAQETADVPAAMEEKAETTA
jgi:hypothetical protein